VDSSLQVLGVDGGKYSRSNVTVERSRHCDEDENKAMPMPPRKLMLLVARQG
jgi:hypothetical protein